MYVSIYLPTSTSPAPRGAAPLFFGGGGLLLLPIIAVSTIDAITMYQQGSYGQPQYSSGYQGSYQQPQGGYQQPVTQEQVSQQQQQQQPAVVEDKLSPIYVDTQHDDMVHDAQLDFYGTKLATGSSGESVSSGGLCR